MFAPILSRLPPQLQRETLTGALPIPEGMDAKFIESFKRAEQLVKRLWDRKITIVAGTDTVVGIVSTTSSSSTPRPASPTPTSCRSRPSARRA